MNGFVTINNLNGTELVCSTDQIDCCTNSSVEGGGWFDPNGTRIEFGNDTSQGFYVAGGDQEIRLLRGTGIPVPGLYTCRVADNASTTKVVHVGLYNEDGG